jgi:hypothetical protein
MAWSDPKRAAKKILDDVAEKALSGPRKLKPIQKVSEVIVRLVRYAALRCVNGYDV